MKGIVYNNGVNAGLIEKDVNGEYIFRYEIPISIILIPLPSA